MATALIVSFALAWGLVGRHPAPPALQPPAEPHSNPNSGYVPVRVYDTRRQAFSDFEAMLADLARADVVIVGEQHGDPNTHRLQAAMLEGLLRRGVHVTISLEMFERDVQPALSDYLGGAITQEEFLTRARPWPRYASDYRPLVELARAHGRPVIAANVPRRLASAIATGGLDELDRLSAAERALVASELRCPLDAYFERFTQAMSAHPPAGVETEGAEAKREVNERYYHSQCAKDETMAEAIVAAFARLGDGRATIVHFNGAFHSDFGCGVTERVRRRVPGRRVALVSILPVTDIDAVVPAEEDLRRAEYLVYTVK